MKIELPNPHINQSAILESKARFRVVMAGRRFGKSELSQIEIIVNALQGKQVFYVTPTYNLARVFFRRSYITEYGQGLSRFRNVLSISTNGYLH